MLRRQPLLSLDLEFIHEAAEKGVKVPTVEGQKVALRARDLGQEHHRGERVRGPKTQTAAANENSRWEGEQEGRSRKIGSSLGFNLDGRSPFASCQQRSLSKRHPCLHPWDKKKRIRGNRGGGGGNLVQAKEAATLKKNC